MTELMPIEWPFPFQGLNTELHASKVPPTNLVVANNVYYPTPRTLRARGGIDQTYTGSANDVARMYYWEYDSKLYHADDTNKLYKAGSVLTGVVAPVTDMCAYVDSNGAHWLIVAENEVTDPTLHTYDGATYSVLTGDDVPRCTLIMSRSGRLWATGDADHDSRVYCAKPGDHTYWSPEWDMAAWWDVAPGLYGKIIGWVDYMGILYIFKQGAVYKMAGDRPIGVTIHKVNTADSILTGAMSDCIKGVLYATKYGVYPVGPAVPMYEDNLTRDIETEFQAAVESGAQAAFSPELGAYVLVNGTTTAYVSSLGNRPDVWTTFTLPVAMKSVYCANGLWFGGTNGKVYKYDHDDWKDGTKTEFEVRFKTGDWNLGENLHRKHVAYLEGDLNAKENATAILRLYTDKSAKFKVERDIEPNDQNVVRCSLNCDYLALEMLYRHRTGVAHFGGVRLVGKSLGKVL